MEINNNTFIDILGLPEWNDKVLEVLEYLKLDRPIVEKGEIYAYISSDEFGIDIMFDYNCIAPDQKAMEADGNLYVSQITFKEKTPLVLPFSLLFEYNYNSVIKKLRREPDLKSLGSNKSFSWDIDCNKKYRLIADFKDDNLDSLKEVWMRLEQ